LEDIPPRRRAIFLASRIEGLSHQEIAQRLGVTTRIVERELEAAFGHFREVLEKKVEPRRGPRSLKTS
jgi:RNA polymerase sigma-70 factor (ECF subfamily)